MLAAAATEFDCRSSLEVARVRADVTTAMAELHHARGYGQHTLIDCDEAIEAKSVEPAAWDARVRRLAQPAEIALPALLAAGAQLDFAVLVIGQDFDTAFQGLSLRRPDAARRGPAHSRSRHGTRHDVGPR